MASLPYPIDASSLVSRHKRRGVALSCAECRRLKLKCSRVFPCSNCVKKGCSAICPDGSLTTGKGNRFVLANTEILHEKINQLSNRVRQLEDGLSESHGRNSSMTHPLLTEDLLKIKRPLERERQDHPSILKDDKADLNDDIDSVGSLSISPGGRATFFGQTANSWYLLQNEEGLDEEEERVTHSSPQPTSLPWLDHAFPFASPANKSTENIRGSILPYLPQTLTAAKKICDIYFRHAAWMYTPISENDFLETIFRPMYEQNGIYQGSVSSHSLAVLFLVLSIGTLLDLDMPAHSPQAMHYYQLGRAALALDSVIEEQTIPGIQALVLMCHFMFLSDMGGPRWVIMGMAVKLAQSLGLHRDSGKWNLNVEESRKRRELFYELLTYDSWQSLTFGRPPSLSMLHVDTKLPHETFKNSKGEVEMSFAAWKHRFSSQCLSVVHDQAFGARTPNYKVIQELDKKVRQDYVPPSLQVPGFGGGATNNGHETEQPTIQLTMQRYIAFAIKEISLFYMHRGYFAQAMEDSPTDPMGSKYSQSVLAAYTSATTFVGLIESLFKQHPGLTERMWFLFTHVFSCSIVLGSIAVKPQMALAPSALSHLQSAYHLFARVSDKSRTNKILPILQKLSDRAYAALPNSQHQRENGTRSPIFGVTSIKTETADELSTLGGMTRLVTRGTPSSPSYSESSPASASQASPPPTTHDGPRFADVASAPTWQYYTPVQQQHQQQHPYVEPSSPYHLEDTVRQTDLSHIYAGQVPGTDFYGYSMFDYHGMNLMTSPTDNSAGQYMQPNLNLVWQNFADQVIHK